MDYKPDENDQITKWLLPYDSHGPSEHGLKLTEMQWIEAEQKRIRFPTIIKERKENEIIEISLWKKNPPVEMKEAECGDLAIKAK